MKPFSIGKTLIAGLFCAGVAVTTQAQTLSSNATGTNNGFYYTFWKDSGNASMTLGAGGRYTSQWTNNTNNWVGGKGWNPGGPKVVNYSGTYSVDNSQNSYLALYGWTTSPLIEYYVIESYGSYNPSSCSGGVDYGSFQSDGATYNVRRCQRVQQPSIQGTQTFYQYFSVRTPKKGFGQISGTITVANHFNFWASKGLNLGSHDYMVMATEGYQSTGGSDITVSEGTGGGNQSSAPSSSGGQTSSAPSTGGNGGAIVVRARGAAGGESISLRVGGSAVANWALTTSYQNYTYTGGATGDIQVQFTNDGGDRDVQVDYLQVNGETRQAEDMSYNTGVYQNGSCGNGSNSEWLHCNGVIGFGSTSDCFSNNCSGGGTGGNTGGNSSSSSSSNNASCSGYVGITFDDGPHGNTSTLISLLNQHNLKPVTWFVQGNYMQANGTSALVSQMLAVGEIQNHSWDHPQMGSMSYSQIYDQLNQTNQMIQSKGAAKPTLFRPPYGTVNSTITQAATALGLRTITWDVDSQDWNSASAAQIAAAANTLQNGQVILLHDANYQANTNAAIAQIAANLRAKGLCPGRIDPATGRAVAPNNSGSGSTSSTPANNTSSSAVSSTVSSTASSTPSNGSACQCNWWGTLYPSCTNQTSGWGWENNRNCIGTSTCTSQGQGGGGLVCN